MNLRNVEVDAIDLDASIQMPFMDPRLYLDPEVFRLELDEVLPTCWILVGDVDQLVEPGDAIVEVIGNRPVLVVRDGQGTLRSFGNVCSQCGSILVERSANVGAGIRCPSHGSAFDFHGVPAGATGRTPRALTSLSVSVWERFVFVNPSGTAPPLSDYLHPLPSLLRGHDIDRQQRSVSFVHEARANWKLLVDNGFCDYHVPFVHSRLMPLIERLETWGQEVHPYVTLLTAPLSDLGLAEQPLYRGIGRDPELARRIGELTMAAGIFPNLLLLAFRTGVVHLISWWPIAIDRTAVRVQAYAHERPTPDDMRYGAESVERLQFEDIGVCELVQRGLASSLYRPGPRHHLETRVRGFHDRYHEELRAALARRAFRVSPTTTA
jgi:phenylpropionate dioxygenase-like ring-hydroxylating dioxygenase large terminal subunit